MWFVVVIVVNAQVSAITDEPLLEDLAAFRKTLTASALVSPLLSVGQAVASIRFYRTVIAIKRKKLASALLDTQAPLAAAPAVADQADAALGAAPDATSCHPGPAVDTTGDA